MYKHFTFKLFTTKRFNEFVPAGLKFYPGLKAPENRVDFIKKFSRSYEFLDLKSCSEHDMVKN